LTSSTGREEEGGYGLAGAGEGVEGEKGASLFLPFSLREEVEEVAERD
jgi:hypothetical protein